MLQLRGQCLAMEKKKLIIILLAKAGLGSGSPAEGGLLLHTVSCPPSPQGLPVR